MTEWRDITYFTRKEFGFWNGVEPDEDLVLMLDEARRFAGIPMEISEGGGIRGPRHDGDTSSHTRGRAVDIRCADSKSRKNILEALVLIGFRRIGIYDRHIHVDNDPTKPQDVIWVGVSQ